MPVESAKRQPLLLDRVLALSPDELARGAVDRKTAAQVIGHLRQAKPFVLDPQAISRFARVARELPELVAEQQQFAKAPYEVTWIEFDYTQFWRELKQREPDEDCDSSVGYLLVGNDAYVLAWSLPLSKKPVLGPVRYHLHQPWTLAQQLEFCSEMQTSRMQLAAWLWGGHAFQSMLKGNVNALCDAHTPEFMLSAANRPALSRLWSQALTSMSGDLRNIITILMLLNRPQLVRYVRAVDRGRGWIRNKSVPYYGYTTVTLDLDPEPILRSLSPSQKSQDERRRHEVRGHYRHDRAWKEGSKKLCVHEVEPLPRSKRKDESYRCRKCGGKKWWAPEHLRGSAEKGFMIKTYEVTSTKENA